jgi:hypothetical protein
VRSIHPSRCDDHFFTAVRERDGWMKKMPTKIHPIRRSNLMTRALHGILACCALLLSTSHLPASLAIGAGHCTLSAAPCSTLASDSNVNLARVSLATSPEIVARERARTPGSPLLRSTHTAPARIHTRMSAALVRRATIERLCYAAELLDAASARSCSPSTGPPTPLHV